MIYHGQIKNGIVVLDEKPELPEGTEVEVQTIPSPPRKTLAERFQNVIGRATVLPDDMAAQHDHYIHGSPKK